MNCPNCNAEVSDTAKFCKACGTRLRCGECNAVLEKGSKFCGNCGAGVERVYTSQTSEKNTAKYYRKGDEISCEVSLNDEVAKEGIVSLFNNIASGKDVSYERLTNKELYNNNQLQNGTDDPKQPEAEDITPLSEEPTAEKKETSTATNEIFPHLNDLEMTLECSEGEWILVYAFYESAYASKSFTRKAVYDKYMFKRKTDTRIKNFSTNWKGLFKHYISTVNENNFRFKSERLEHVKNIVLGKEKGFQRSTTNRTRTQKKEEEVNGENQQLDVKKGTKSKSSISAGYSLMLDLNLNPKDKKSLKYFFAIYKTKEHQEHILVIVYYLEKMIQVQSIDENKIYTCYKNLGLPVPNIHKALVNIRGRKGWINTSSFSDLKISVSGENHIEHEMTKNQL